MNLLEVKNICKTYGSGETAVKALRNVSFSVPKGEYVAIVGESGSGKSTLLNMIGALDMPTSGKVLIDGKDIFSMNDRKLTVFRRRNIGFIFQAFNLIPELTVETYSFRDKRDERTTGTYMAFVFCVYAFLAIIALVTVMNIINSISMSVSTRMKQYGAMRAVGMDERQMTKMIACEAFTYAVLGCVVGCAIGLPLSKLLYDFLIAGHFPSAVWQFPITSLGVILLFVSIAAIAAVYTPAKRIRNMSITATINEL